MSRCLIIVSKDNRHYKYPKLSIVNYSIVNYQSLIKKRIMLKIITQLSMFLVGTLAQAQVGETREMENFSKIIVKDGIEVVIMQGDSNEIKVEASDAVSLNDLITEVSNNTLLIY